MRADSKDKRNGVLASMAMACVCFGLGYGVTYWISHRGAAGAMASDAGKSLAETPPREVEADEVPSTFSRVKSEIRRMENEGRRGDFESMLRSPLFHRDRHTVIRDWAAKDPEGLWNWYQKEGREVLGSFSPLNTLFMSWFKKDAAKAIETLRGLEDHERSMAANGILSLVFGDDPELAARAAGHLDDLVFRGSNVGAYLGNTVTLESIGRVLALPSSVGRDAVLKAAAGRWFESDWKEASAWVAALPEDERRNVLPELIRKAVMPPNWGGGQRSDTATAEKLAWARELLEADGNAALRVNHGPEFVRNLGAEDPGAALAWAAEHLGGMTRANAVSSIIDAQSAKDISAAATLVGGLPPGHVRNAAAGTLFGKWIGSDSAAALAWARAELGGGGELSRGDWSQAGSQFGFTNAGAARAYLEAPVEDLPGYFGAAALANLVRANPEDTLRWAAGVGGERADVLVGKACELWAHEEPARAAAYLGEHDPQRNVPPEHYGNVASRWFNREPEGALGWALSLAPAQREMASSKILRMIDVYYPQDERAAAWWESLR